MWPDLSLVKAWLVTHWPEEKERQVEQVGHGQFGQVWGPNPPQIVRLSMVWPCLSSGSEGSSQLWPVVGLNTSTLLSEPPDIIIPRIGLFYSWKVKKFQFHILTHLKEPADVKQAWPEQIIIPWSAVALVKAEVARIKVKIMSLLPTRFILNVFQLTSAR